MLRSVSLAVALVLVANAASAQTKFRPQGSAEDKACRGDSHRLCQEVFPDDKSLEPDRFKMLACLQQHRAKLSKACNEMLQNHGV